MINKIKEHFSQYDLDIRKSNYGRFIDQKVTPDVLTFIADCVLNYTGGKSDINFSSNDIWKSDYFLKNLRVIFSKPQALNETAANEYDKFISQPLKALAYAKVLNEEKINGKNIYKVVNSELLEYIALKERYSFNFLKEYLEKVLKDSDFYRFIENFIEIDKNSNNSEEVLQDLKYSFQKFMRGNTMIGTRGSDGTTEINRIFPKVLNIFAVEYGTKGLKKGHLSQENIYFTDLMYNRINFRDLKKDKRVSRKEAILSREAKAQVQLYNDYLIAKAMKIIKEKYKFSEVADELANEQANYVHHIFPKNEFPNLAHYLENLIKLTASQHFTKAHPNGKTTIVNKDYQLVCLLAKTKSIEDSIRNGEFIYSKPNLTFVINTGLSLHGPDEIKPSFTFEEIKSRLISEYKK